MHSKVMYSGKEVKEERRFRYYSMYFYIPKYVNVISQRYICSIEKDFRSLSRCSRSGPKTDDFRRPVEPI